jgi:cyclase
LLKKRIIPVLFIKNSIVVQSISFKTYRPIGCPKIAVDFLIRWGADEIIIIDLDAAYGAYSVNFEMIRNIASMIDIPLSYGGGLNNIEDTHGVFQAGADKVIFNQALHKNKTMVQEIIHRYGSQAVIGSFDIKYDEAEWKAFDYKTKCFLSDVCINELAAELGVGEVFINSVDRDGSLLGYDISACLSLNKVLTVPLIFCGGCSDAEDMADLFSACPELSAAAAGNFFHFTELSVHKTKTYISETVPVRLSY